jgi:hypothetical protein
MNSMPRPKIHLLHRELLEIAAKLKLDRLTIEGLEEFFGDMFESLGAKTTHLGPGFIVTRAGAYDEPGAVMYKIVVWGTIVIYGAILLATDLAPNNGAVVRPQALCFGWRFVMADAHIVYVDDSGTDSKSRVATAAFCVSTPEKWLDFERKWRNISINAGFKHFHMTEFAACKYEKPCPQCIKGETTLEDHPWRRWTTKKRKNVLNRLAGAIVEFVEYGVGIAHTKQDYEEHVRTSHARLYTAEPIGEQHFTFAVQRCGGELAKWRASTKVDSPLKFVFDLSSKKQRDEIAKIFFGAANSKPQYQDGLEQWFLPAEVSYESRKSVVQLLAADMLAWVTATVRARELFRRGETLEMFQIANIFADTTHIRMGYTPKETLAKWEKDILNGAQGGDPS